MCVCVCVGVCLGNFILPSVGDSNRVSIEIPSLEMSQSDEERARASDKKTSDFTTSCKELTNRA
jgi:hypothetical protein